MSNNRNEYGSVIGWVLAQPWASVLQRVPGLWLVSVVMLGLWGAAVVPYTYAIYVVVIHVLSVNAAVRTALGARNAHMEATRHAFRGNGQKMLAHLTVRTVIASLVLMHLPTDTPDWDAHYANRTSLDPHALLSADADYLALPDVAHVIIIPGYKETDDTWADTLNILASHQKAVSHYKICLAMEEADPLAEKTAMLLVSRYIDCFLQIVYTIHPRNLAGETAGKHSNVSWAARQMASKSKSVKSDLLTVMDCDTAFAQDYFDSIAAQFAATPRDLRVFQMFAPGTVFDRNSNDVPVFVRLADILWSAGVMGNYVPFSPITFPCSAYSLSMDLAQSVGFWDVGPEGLGEDMHMLLKCFFATEGRVKVNPVFSPASCCNIEGKEGSGAVGFMWARYGQAKRHLWGALDSGYALRKALFAIIAPGYENPIVGRPPVSDKKKQLVPDDEVHFNFYKLLVLFHRLMEAHIVGGHLFILVTLSSIFLPVGPNPSSFATHYWESITDQAVHPIVVLACDICGYLRAFSVFSVIACAYYYERYYRWVGVTRWNLSSLGDRQQLTSEASPYINGVYIGPGKRVGHLGRRAGLESIRTKWNYLDWFALPITALLYQAIPQIHTQILQLWTDKLVYETAAKPKMKEHPAAHAVPEESGVVHVFGGHEKMPGETVAIPVLDSDDIETLANSRVDHGPDEILVLQGLKAHRISNTSPSTPTTPTTYSSNFSNMTATTQKYMHSHTNSYSSNPANDRIMLMGADYNSDTVASFPASPRLATYHQQPPPPYVQSPVLRVVVPPAMDRIATYGSQNNNSGTMFYGSEEKSLMLAPGDEFKAWGDEDVSVV
ncbi:hypothetical protein HK100_000656 [Physocladia obscura]|uniref:Glycosyltransferase 2-like domain-containing protein n=1 Tax=Physocladia obscura TaxID=109957 RepID=A0AAD5SZT2_9FUNG|nr:hypothetical protein HK100_000656 [Physocladia obscura]